MLEAKTEIQEKKKVSSIPTIILLALMYIIVAMSDNFKGIFVPTFKSEFAINDTQIGYLLMASLFAYAVFQYFGGVLIEKLGSFKKIIALGFGVEIISLLFLIFCSNYLMLIIGLFGIHAGMAMFNVSINSLGPVIPVASTAVLMNFLVFCYGLGSTGIQKLTGDLLSLGIEWNQFYLFMMIASIALLAYLMILRLPEIPKTENDLKAAESTINFVSAIKNKTLILYILAAGFYLSCEYGAGNWFANYMSDSYGMDASERAFYVTVFFGIMTVGRIFGGFIADKFGYFKSIIAFATLASACTIIGMLFKEQGLIIVSISGFFYSLIFPTTITSIGRVFKTNVSYFTGLILMGGTLIAMVISMMIGVLNDKIGSYYSYYTIGICMALCTFFIILINQREKIK